MPASALLLGDCSLAEIPPPAGAVWLRPSEWPRGTDYLFRPRPVDTSTAPTVISRYHDVQAVMLGPAGAWSHEVPLDVVPPDERHCVIDASWARDGDLHQELRRMMRAINRGSTAEARAFTRELTGQLLTRLMAEDPPWNLSRAIDDVSMRVIIEHTLQAPPLLEHAVRLRYLARNRVSAPSEADGVRSNGLDYFGMVRQTEFDEILGCVAASYDELPDGLARYLVSLCRSGHMTSSQLISQLGLLVVSFENQATTVASLIGMLLEYGLYDYALGAAGQPELVRRLVAEGNRRGIGFPVSVVTPVKPVVLGGEELPAGEPVLISYAAANMDPARFGTDAAGFDPRPQRPQHLAFGEGLHRCQGKVGAEQFIEDVLLASLETLPPKLRLDHDGQLLREVTAVSWTIPCLPVSPA